MGEGSKIAWTDNTFNPVKGCEKVSDGCKFCYAERDTKRYGLNYCHEISINRRGYEHRYVVIKLHASAPSREQAWKEAIERIKSASLTREEHAAVDRALAEITK